MTLRYLSENAFASDEKRMQNLLRFINNKNTELDQRRMPNRMQTNQPFRYPGSEIENAFASNEKRMQNLSRFINNKNTELDQRRMPNRMQIQMSGCEYEPLKWQKYKTLQYLSSGF